MLNKDNQRGAAAIITIVVVAASALIMALSAGYLGLGNMEIATTFEKGELARDFIDTCADEGLERLRKDDLYTGSSLSLDGNSCIISVTSVGTDYTVVVNGSVDEYYQSLEIEVDLSSGNLIIDSWQEN